MPSRGQEGAQLGPSGSVVGAARQEGSQPLSNGTHARPGPLLPKSFPSFRFPANPALRGPTVSGCRSAVALLPDGHRLHLWPQCVK